MVNTENALRALIPSGTTVSQFLIYFGALFVVALVVFGWAVYRTQRGQRRSRRQHLKAAAKYQPLPEYQSRRPTLAEAGGLPPIRTGKQPPSPA